MRSSIIVVVFLVPLVASKHFWNHHESRCKNSSYCADGSSCVQGSCFDCTLDPIKCLRSAEICTSLKCASDENCYLRYDVDNSSNTATVKTVCSKSDPCAQASCSDGCATISHGDQPPVAKCLSVNNSNPCKGHKCPKGYKCFVKTAYDNGLPSKIEASCADMSACENCGVFQYCVIQVQPDGSIKGACSWSPQLI